MQLQSLRTLVYSMQVYMNSVVAPSHRHLRHVHVLKAIMFTVDNSADEVECVALCRPPGFVEVTLLRTRPALVSMNVTCQLW